MTQLDTIKQTLRRTIQEGELARERLERLEAYEEVTTGSRRGSPASESGQARTSAGG
jgi:hypothetical protein